MTEVHRIDLYDFAKMALGGEEPESVIFLESDRKTVISKVEFSGAGDYLPSVKFSQSDLMISLPKDGNFQAKNKAIGLTDFPGLI